MTNNRAELLAAILALIVDDASSIDIHTDSEHGSRTALKICNVGTRITTWVLQIKTYGR